MNMYNLLNLQMDLFLNNIDLIIWENNYIEIDL